MSAPGSARIPPLRCAGALAMCFVAGATVQTFFPLAATPPRTESGSAADPAASSVNTAGRATIPTRESLAALSPEEQITVLAAALPQMELADILPLVEHLVKVRGIAPKEPPIDPFDVYAIDPVSPLLRALFTRWASLDAAGLMAYVESGPLRYDYDTRRLAAFALVEVRGLSVLEEMRAKSPTLARQAAREMLIRQPDQLEALLPFLKAGYQGNELEQMFEMSMDSVSFNAQTLGPERFLRYAAEVENDDMLRAAIGELVNAGLLNQNPDRALELVKALPPGTSRDSALVQVLAVVMEFEDASTDGKCPQFRRAWEALPDGKPKESLQWEYARALIKDDLSAALAWGRGLQNPKLRAQALQALSHYLPDSPERLELATRLHVEAIMVDPSDFRPGLPSMNGSRRPPSTPQFENDVRISFRDWYEASPVAARAWLETVTHPDLRAELVQILIPDQPEAVFLLPDSVTRLEYAVDVTWRRFFSDGDPDLPAAETIPAAWREAARLHYLQDHPPDAAEWEALTPEGRRALSAAAIRERADAPFDPFAVPEVTGEKKHWLSIFNSLPPEERSLGAYYEAGAAYIRSDGVEASEWLDSLPPGAERDAAATALVEHLAQPGDSQDGEAAFAWAAAMSGETERARYTAEAIRAWSSADSSAARLGIESAPLPPAEKSALRALLVREGGAR